MASIPPENYPLHCEGSLTWLSQEVYEDTCELTSAVVRSSKDIALEALFDGYRYTIVLASLDGFQFSGNFISEKEGESARGTMQAALYFNGPHFFLYGKWIEWGDEYYVIVRFRAEPA